MCRIDFITTHGTFNLVALKGERVLALLHRHQIPWTAVSTYLRNSETEEDQIFPCLHIIIDSLPQHSILTVIYQRNIDPFLFTRTKVQFSPPTTSDQAVTEYLYRDLLNATSSPTIIRQLAASECRAIVEKRVHEMLGNFLPPAAGPTKIVIGISGGGDSNALITAMHSYRNDQRPIELIPVIIRGPGEWDAGIPRAKAICENLSLPLTVITESQTREILRIPEDGTALLDRFAKAYPGEDYEAMGTLIIRMSLAHVARTTGARYICTGLNLEDLLAEMFLRLAGQSAPAALPVRDIDGLKLIYPLWLLPKKIIDGCYPKYSYTNYNERYPSFVEGRALCYQIAYSITADFPQIGERLLRATSSIANQFDQTGHYDDDFGFQIDKSVPLPTRERFKRFLRG